MFVRFCAVTLCFLVGVYHSDQRTFSSSGSMW